MKINTSLFLSFAIVFGAIFGIIFPQFVIFEPYYVPLLALLVFMSSFEVTLKDIQSAFLKPKNHLALAVISYAWIAPISLFLSIFFKLPFELTGGYVLAAMAPPAAGTAYYTGLFKGKVSVAISISTVGMLLLIFMMPITSSFLLHTTVKINPVYIFRMLIYVILIPLALVFIVRKFVDFKPYKDYVVIPIYFILLASMFALNSNVLFSSSYSGILILLAALNLIFLAVPAWLFSKNFSNNERVPFLFGAVFRNQGIIAVLSIVSFGALAALPSLFIIVLQLPIVVYLLICFSK